jgi:transposase
MYLRTTQRRNRDGLPVRYLQLAHNRWDAKAGRSTAQVLYNFGRQDQLDQDAIRRLINSLNRVLQPPSAQPDPDPAFQFIDSRPLGGAWLLDQLWQKLGLHTILGRLLRGRRLDPGTERTLFAMVANRALKPLSKLGCAAWANQEAVIPGLLELDEDRCYRAMDWLLELEAELSEQVYWAVADLVNLEVDLLFFDTTSTYFETDGADPPTEQANKGFRTYNPHSKDHRPDLPQVVIGMAVTRTGIPIRVWTWPGNASDQNLIEQAKQDLRAWKLNRVVWVADAGFNSARNRRYLQRGGSHYIVGERLHQPSKEAKAVLALGGGPWVKVADNLQVREVVFDEQTMHDRFVVCYNPHAAASDASFRERCLEELREAIAGNRELPVGKCGALASSLKTKKPLLHRFLRIAAGGFLDIDLAKVAADQRLDGLYLLRTSDRSLSAEDVALGYKQLLQVERAWRDLKTTLDLRPVYHRKEERIRAHVLLCWLALLVVRLAEQGTGSTWARLRRDVEKMHLGQFQGQYGLVQQRTQTTASQRSIFQALGIQEPPLFFQLEPASAAETA